MAVFNLRKIKEQIDITSEQEKILWLFNMEGEWKLLKAEKIQEGYILVSAIPKDINAILKYTISPEGELKGKL